MANSTARKTGGAADVAVTRPASSPMSSSTMMDVDSGRHLQGMESLHDMHYDMMQQMQRFHDDMNRACGGYSRPPFSSMTPYRLPYRRHGDMLGDFSSFDRDPFFALTDSRPSISGPSPPYSSALSVPSTNSCMNAIRPKVDIRDEPSQLVVHVDLPGIEKENVKVDVVDGMLKITAEHKEDKARDEANFYMRERSVGKFQRSFRMPDNVKEEQMKAAFNHGVLEVTLPKEVIPEERKRSIAIQ